MMSIAIAISVLASSVITLHAESPQQANDVLQLQRQAVIAVEAGKYDEAIRVCNQELKIFLSARNEAAAGAVYIDLAEIDHIGGLFPKAEAKYKKGIELLKRYGPSDDGRLVAAMDGLGWLYVTWGRFVDGMRLMDEARARGERAHLNAAQLIKHLDTQAAYLVVQGRYSEARQEWNRAADIGKASFGPDPEKFDYVLLHFGQASALYGDYATAAKTFHDFLQLDLHPSGASLISKAVAEGELAHIYVETHKLSEAEPLFEQSIGSLQASSLEAPLIYSMVLSYFGDYYMATKNWSKAELQYRRALGIRRKVVGNSHAAAKSMLALSKALQKLHLKHEAKQLVAEAKVILVAEHNPAQDDTVDVLALQRE